MVVEDEVVGALKKSEQSRKSKKRKERNDDTASGSPAHIVNGDVVEGHKSFEEKNLTKKKSDDEGVEGKKKKKKAAIYSEVGAHVEDANKSFEEENLTKKKSSDEGVERKMKKKKAARDSEVGARVEGANKSFVDENLTKKKSDDEGVERKMKKKKAATDSEAGARVEDVNKSFEEENLTKKKSDDEVVERKKKKKKPATDSEVGVRVEDANKGFEDENLAKKNSDEGVERKMKKKKKQVSDDKEGLVVEDTDKITFNKAEKRKKKREVESNNYELHAASNDTADDSVDKGDQVHSTSAKMHESNRKHEKVRTKTDGCTEGKMEKKKKNKKEKRKGDSGSLDVAAGLAFPEGTADLGGHKTQVKDSSKDPKLNSSKKKVRFSNELEVFPRSNVPGSGKDQSEEPKLVRGKRFSKEEDQIVEEAVKNYIELHNLGEEGLNMVLNCSRHREVRNCWKEIGACIPYRPYVAVYYRAQVLFRRSKSRKWTESDYALVREHYKLNGNKWKELAEELGTHRVHLKDTWRRIKLPNVKRGHWSQDEYQKLFDLVNTDMQLKMFEEKKSKHGMLRDNICWTAISDNLSTRTGPTCCLKWYGQLTSPLVAQGVWSDADDYRLIGALYDLDATCIENVDWDNLLDHRSGEVCLKRWKQMVLHVGNYVNKPFPEQVEVLVKRYCPSLTEAREVWDSKPVVP